MRRDAHREFASVAPTPPRSRATPRSNFTSAATPRSGFGGFAPAVGPVARLSGFASATPSPRATASPRRLPHLPPTPAGEVRRRKNPRTRQQARLLWRSEVKGWLEAHDRVVDWAWKNPREQEELSLFFTALDVDNSGTVEEDEIRAMMAALGVKDINAHQLGRMFASVGKDVSASLSKPEFVQLMSLHSDSLTGLKKGEVDRRTGGLFNANVKLMMLAYRRNRLLEDCKDPTKRRRFVDMHTFSRHYHTGAGSMSFKTPRAVLPPIRPAASSAAPAAAPPAAAPPAAPAPAPAATEAVPSWEEQEVSVVSTEASAASVTMEAAEAAAAAEEERRRRPQRRSCRRSPEGAPAGRRRRRRARRRRRRRQRRRRRSGGGG